MTNRKNRRDAEAHFARKEIAAHEGAKAVADYDVATREKTVRLKSQRLAKEAADKQADLDAKNVLPIPTLMQATTFDPARPLKRTTWCKLS